MVVGDAVDVAVLPGHERCTGRGAERIHHESVAEAYPLGGDAIEIWSLEPGEATFLALFLLDDAHCVPALVVGEDVDEVGFTVGGVREGGEAGEEE